MKKKEIKELHTKTKEELVMILRDIRKELEKSRIELAMNKLKNSAYLKQMKKDIARILTVIKEKEVVVQK